MLKKIIILAVVISSSSLLHAQEKLTLDKAILLGLKNSYGISISKMQSEVADINNSWGMVGAYPTITGTAQFNFSNELIDNSQTSSVAGASVDATWTLFNGFKIKTSKRINETKYELAQNSEVIQIENCISDIVMSYYTYVLEKELLEFNKTLLLLSEDRYNRDKILNETGPKGIYELIQSESAYLVDKQNLIAQEKRVKTAMYNLNLAMSTEIDAYWSIEDKINVPNNDYAVGLLRDRMLNDNTTLKYQYINQKVIEQNITLAKGDIMPKLDVKAGGRYNFSLTDNGLSKLERNSLEPYAGLTLSATIFAGQIKQRNISIASIQSKIGEVSIEQIKREMTTTLMNEYDNYDYNRKLLELATRELEVAKINLDLSLERFNGGTINSFDYRAVQLAYLKAAYNKEQLIFAVLKANVELSRLTGGLVQEYRK